MQVLQRAKIKFLQARRRPINFTIPEIQLGQMVHQEAAISVKLYVL